MPTMPDEAFFSLAPDWLCEVLSPATEKIDRVRKLRIYAEAGLEHAWLLKPTDRTLEVLHLHEGTWTIVGVCSESDVVRIKPFEAIELELGRLWLDEAPAASPDAG
jgi:Uma2 family endonuclease